MRKHTLNVLTRTLMVASATALFTASANADTNADITVTATVPSNVSTIDYRDSQSQTLKQALSTNFDLSLVQAQRQRAGLVSVNLRGLQGNRVGLTLDGVLLAEAIEFSYYTNVDKSIASGRGNYIEPTSLVSVLVDTNAGGDSLSGSVNFKTINPEDILKGKANAGYLFTNYNSVDRSFTASSAYAIKSGAYQGMLLGTYRKGHEQINGAGKQDKSVVGAKRLAADPQDNKTGYVLTKHFYQLNESNKLGLTLELLRNNYKTNELSTVNTGGRRSTYNYAFTDDSASRVRFDLSNEYESDGLVWNTKFTYQNSESNYRRTVGYTQSTATGASNIPSGVAAGAAGRPGSSSSASSSTSGSTGTATGTSSSTGSSTSSNGAALAANGAPAGVTTTTTTAATTQKGTQRKLGEYSYKSFTLANQVRKNLELAGLQHQLVVDANVNYAISDFNVHINDSITGYSNQKLMPKSKELRTLLRLTDRIVFADYNLIVKPQLSLVYSGISSSTAGGYVQYGGNYPNLAKKNNFRVLPALYVEKVINRNLRPYFNYSYGARIPSVQHYYSSTSRGTMGTNLIYAVGNPNLKVETSHNFELGVTGSNENIAYKVAGFVNKYHNFITTHVFWNAESAGNNRTYTYFSYKNRQKQTLMGAVANLRFNIGHGWKAVAALQYTDGYYRETSEARLFPTNTDDSTRGKLPLNSVDPLRWSVGFNYDASNWGASITGTYIGAKADEDLKLDANQYTKQVAFNPTTTAFVVDASVYYKPTDYLTINAGVNNLFNKTYVNWSTISYYYSNLFETSGDMAGVTKDNWLSFTEPGRNYFISAKFEF